MQKNFIYEEKTFRYPTNSLTLLASILVKSPFKPD